MRGFPPHRMQEQLFMVLLMKRARAATSGGHTVEDLEPDPFVPKRSRRQACTRSKTGIDFLSPLSDEMLIRILSHLSLPHLLSVVPVSRRFCQLAADSQLWKALYYTRFILPRTLKIPRFRDVPKSSYRENKLHDSGRRAVWADGQRGGLVYETGDRGRRVRNGERKCGESIDWKRQYKIRHNWSKGKCAVEELRLSADSAGQGSKTKMMVKVLEGLAITADQRSGLRAWDLKRRAMLAQVDLNGDSAAVAPRCLSVDDRKLEAGLVELAIGFDDGSFGVWRLHLGHKTLVRYYRHQPSSTGQLIAMAFSHPYLLTATESFLVSLYTFEVSDSTAAGVGTVVTGQEAILNGNISTRVQEDSKTSPSDNEQVTVKVPVSDRCLSVPYLLTSLKSQSSGPPLALSIRPLSELTVASIAYTFLTRSGWSIGVQDLHIRHANGRIKSRSEITTTRLAYTAPIDSGSALRTPMSPPTTPRPSTRNPLNISTEAPSTRVPLYAQPGPTALCYAHPYLLAILPDNTLVLHMCTSNASSLSITRGTRLWGHTSGISDAEITTRGKAVSVSSRGQEMRMWELEGQTTDVGNRSVEIRPRQSSGHEQSIATSLDDGVPNDWEEERSWVGFDDEMVIVLTEKEGGKERLLVYDFT